MTAPIHLRRRRTHGAHFASLLVAFLSAFLSALASAPAPAQAPARTEENARSAAPEPTRHPFLWRIEGRDGGQRAAPSWLYGTMHLGDRRLVALPPVVAQAIDASEALFCELRMDELQKEAVKLTRKMSLPRGESLEELLPADLYQKLDARLQKYGVSARRFHRLRIWGVSLTLAQLEAAKAGMTLSLDQKIYASAKADGKEVGGLETVGEQLDAIASSSVADQITMLREGLEHMDEVEAKGQSTIGRMLDVYLSGSDAALLDFVEETMGDDAAFNQRVMKPLLDERNERMADRIDAKLRAKPERKYFFAVGAMHHVGETGVVARLRRKGYRVTRIQPPLPSWEEYVRMRTELQELRAEVERLRQQLAASRK